MCWNLLIFFPRVPSRAHEFWYFLNIANHVICIKENFYIKDEASIRFAEVFYGALFVDNMSVCNAYEISVEDIRKRFGDAEADKYMIMLKGKQHECYPIHPPESGEAHWRDKVPSLCSIPARETLFEGR